MTPPVDDSPPTTIQQAGEAPTQTPSQPTTGPLPVVDPDTPPEQLGWAGPATDDPPRPAGS